MAAGSGARGQQCQCVPDQTAPPALKWEAAANTPGLTQLGREKGRKDHAFQTRAESGPHLEKKKLSALC